MKGLYTKYNWWDTLQCSVLNFVGKQWQIREKRKFLEGRGIDLEKGFKTVEFCWYQSRNLVFLFMFLHYKSLIPESLTCGN